MSTEGLSVESPRKISQDGMVPWRMVSPTNETSPIDSGLRPMGSGTTVWSPSLGDFWTSSSLGRDRLQGEFVGLGRDRLWRDCLGVMDTIDCGLSRCNGHDRLWRDFLWELLVFMSSGVGPDLCFTGFTATNCSTSCRRTAFEQRG